MCEEKDSMYEDGLCERCQNMTDGEELDTYGGYCRHCYDVVEDEE